MNDSPAERAAIVGGVLLAAGLVTAAILYFWPSPPTPEPPGPGPVAEGTASVESPPDPVFPDPPPIDPEHETRVRELRREIVRLREELRGRDEEIERLKARLREAGVSLQPSLVDAAKEAEDAIAELWKCGSETSPTAIEAIVVRLIDLGEPALEPVIRALGSGRDAAFADAWMLTGHFFSAHPTLRVALLDVLRRLSRQEDVSAKAQSAMLNALRSNESALEICLLIGFLEDVRGLASVEPVVEDRARHFLTLEPFRQESLVVMPLLRVLASEEPSVAAESLVTYLRAPDRRPQVAEQALDRIGRLPPEVAVPALVRVAAETDLGERAVAAAEALADRFGAEPVRALAGILGNLSEDARRMVYVRLDDPAAAAASRLKGLKGLAAISALDALEADLAARRGLLDARTGEETVPRLVNALDDALEKIGEIEKRCAKERERVGE